jgi:hypothetical protein
MIANEDFPEEWSFDTEEVENEFEAWSDESEIWWEVSEEGNTDDITSELEGTQEEKEETFSIKELPDSFDKINQIASILQNYPWDITIYITGKEKKVNAEWLELLKKL